MESLFVCPVCGGLLQREARVYRCASGHSFDIASQGYVHLLPSNRRHSAAPGDDRGMVTARNRFLSGGWYGFLAARLASLCLDLAPRDPVVLDSGCGEGYYTQYIASALRWEGQKPRCAGIDISKESVRRAAKRDPDIEFAVASAYALPFPDGCADAVLDCFSPLAFSEFARVTKPGGLLLCVTPGRRHLWELKALLYDEPYENPEEALSAPGFRAADVVSLESRLALPSQAVIHDLFEMTPYFWKTSRAGQERLAAAEALEVTAQFRIHILRREDGADVCE